MIGAELHGLDSRFHAGVRREQNDQDVLIELLDLPQNGDSVRVRKPIVEQDEIDALGEFLHRGASGIRFEHLVPLGLEAFGQRPANQRFVVDDENSGFRHWLRSCQGAGLHSGECTAGAIALLRFCA